MLDLFREITQTIKNNKLRTALTGLAVAWGIFMLIVLLGVARGVVNNFESWTSDSSMNTINMWSGYTSIPFKGYRNGRKIQMRDKDMQALIDEVTNVTDASVSASASGFNIVGPKDYISDGFSAVYPDKMRTEHLEMTNGRFINSRDLSELRRTIVLHVDNATLLFGDPDKALGSEVEALGLAWKVVGIYSHRWRKTSYVPYDTYKAITGGDEYVNQMSVHINGISTEEEAHETEQEIRGVLARQHEFDPSDKNAIWMWNQFANYLSQANGMIYLNMAVWIIGILTLLTGIVGVSNIMFVSVRERIHEIGIRRAIGAKPRNIITQVLTESIAITSLFGYIGIVMGIALLQVLNLFLTEDMGIVNPTIDIYIALEVMVVLVAAGALAGVFPAIKATKVKPVEALRDE